MSNFKLKIEISIPCFKYRATQSSIEIYDIVKFCVKSYSIVGITV